MDSTISDLNKANVTSFVQIRGSVPGQWSQDTAAMSPKPQIYFQNPDPTSKIAGKWKIFYLIFQLIRFAFWTLMVHHTRPLKTFFNISDTNEFSSIFRLQLQ